MRDLCSKIALTIAAIGLASSACTVRREPSQDDTGEALTSTSPNADDAGASPSESTPRSTTPRNIACPPSSAPYDARWSAPVRAVGACTKSQLTDLLPCVVTKSARDQGTCPVALAHPQNQACLGCITPSSSDDRTRALIDDSQPSLVPNVGGCIALKDGETSDKSCGATVNAANACLESACGTCSAKDVDACVHAAAEDGCAELAQNAQCGLQHGVACGLAGSTWLDTASAVAAAFCGD